MGDVILSQRERRALQRLEEELRGDDPRLDRLLRTAAEPDRGVGRPVRPGGSDPPEAAEPPGGYGRLDRLANRTPVWLVAALLITAASLLAAGVRSPDTGVVWAFSAIWTLALLGGLLLLRRRRLRRERRGRARA